MASITLTDITTRVGYLLGTDPNLSTTEIQSMALARYEALHDSRAWSKRRKEFVINLVANRTSTSSDTVTATVGSPTITSAGTPFTSADEGRQIHIGVEPQYYFIAYVSTSSLTLKDGNGTSVNWPRATASSLAWDIFQSVYALPSDADVILSFGADYPLIELDGGRSQLDRLDPHRESVTSDPSHWFYAGINSSNVRQIEVWPVPTTARTLRGLYLVEAPQITGASIIQIHPAVFTYALAADCYNMLFAKSGSTETAYKDLALYYEKKYAETVNDLMPWEVSKNSPPTSITRRRASRNSTDWDVTHDTALMNIWEP